MLHATWHFATYFLVRGQPAHVSDRYTNQFVATLPPAKLAQIQQGAKDCKMDGVTTSDVNVLPIPANAP
jgi:hypothetical protein